MSGSNMDRLRLPAGRSTSLGALARAFLAGFLVVGPVMPGLAQTAQTQGNQSPAVNAGRDVTIIYSQMSPEDRAAFGGTAHLSLVFDASTFALKQWTVIDAQGFQTVVTLFNVDLKTNPDPALFHIDENLPANQLGNRRR